MSVSYVLGVMVIMGVVTWGLRALPFVASRWLEGHPVVARVRQYLPTAVMALLLVHSVATGALAHAQWPVAEGVSIAAVIALQWWLRHALLSIFAGTGLYVLWVNSGWWM